MAKSGPKSEASGEKPSGKPSAAALPSEPVSAAAKSDPVKASETPLTPDAPKPAAAEPVPPVTAREPIAAAQASTDPVKPAVNPVKSPSETGIGAKPADPAKPPGSDAKPFEAASKPSEAVSNKEIPASKPASGASTGKSYELPPVRAAAPRRSTAPMVVAGVLTAALGFGAAWALWGPMGILKQDSELEARLAALEGQTASTVAAAKSAAEAAAAPLSERLTAAETALAGLPSLTEQLAALGSQTEQALAAAAAVDAKLTEMAQRPPASDPAAVAAYERELAALRETFSAQLAQIQAGSDQVLAEIRTELGSELARIEAEAQAASEASAESAALQASAERAAALAALSAALDAGTELGDPLARLGNAQADLPLSGLQDFADGVPTLLSLQESFPEAARAALSAETRSGAGEGGIGGALKGFFGVRSLAPQDGSSTDSILSRAEAALASGDLTQTLAELDALPAAPAAAVQAWRADAERRLAALAAFTTLSDAVEK